MTEPDPLTTKDFSKIEQGLSEFYRPCSIDLEFSARLEKKMVQQHRLKARSFWRRFSSLREHTAIFGWVVVFTAFLAIMIIVIESMTHLSPSSPAGQIPANSTTPNPTISTPIPAFQAASTATAVMLPISSNPNRRVPSPDGRWTAVFNSETGGLEIENSTGVVQMLLGNEITVYGAGWSPDSTMLAISASRKGTDPAQPTVAEIWLSRIDGDTIGEMKPVYLPGESSGVDLSGGLQIDLGVWSPDSSRMTFWQGMMSASTAMDGLPLWVLDANTGGEKKIADQTLLNPGYQSWAPDSRALIFSNGGYRSAQVMKWLSLYRVDSGQTTDLIPVTKLVPGLVAWAPDGKQIAFAAVDAAKTGMDLADYMGWDNSAILARRIYLLDFTTGDYRRLDQTEAYQDAPRWAGKDLLFVQMGQNQVTLIDANLETGVTRALPGCQAALPAAAGTYGQTDWHSLYDSCNSVSQSQMETPSATMTIFPTSEIHQTLPSGLRIDEYALVGPASIEPLTFTTVQGSQPDIFFLPSTPLNTHANQSFDTAGHLTDFVMLGNDKISVTEITGNPTAAGVGVDIQVARDGQIFDTIQAGDVTPLDTLHGLWVYDNHWVLEIAHVSSISGSDNSVSFDAVGQIFLDDILLNERNNYQAAFGIQILNGRPFYFFKRDDRIGIVYDGQEMLLGYTEIPHYGCCSAAELNPRCYVDGVTFLAQRDGRWYYVGIGVTAPAQKETRPAATTAPGVVKPEILAAIRKFSGKDPVNVVYRGKDAVDPSMPGVERDMYSVDGAEYGLDPQTNQVDWYMAGSDQTSGNQKYTVDELQQMALKFVNDHTPGVQIQALSFERGNKGDNYFFRWSTAPSGPGYLAYVQVGFTQNGLLFQYINTLPARNP